MNEVLSIEEYHDLIKKTRRNKYNAQKVEIDGYTFDSIFESERYQYLKVKEKLGEISHLQVHPKFEIWVDGKLIKTYTADFSYICTRRAKGIIEDCKSEPTRKKEGWRLTRKLMEAKYPSYLLVEVVK